MAMPMPGMQSHLSGVPALHPIYMPSMPPAATPVLARAPSNHPAIHPFGGAHGTAGNRGPGKMKEKIYVPTDAYPDFNWTGMLIGSRGARLKAMQQRSGAWIALRGEGRASATDPEAEHDRLHMFIEGTADAIAIARSELTAIFNNPDNPESALAQQDQVRERRTQSSESSAWQI